MLGYGKDAGMCVKECTHFVREATVVLRKTRTGIFNKWFREGEAKLHLGNMQVKKMEILHVLGTGHGEQPLKSFDAAPPGYAHKTM